MKFPVFLSSVAAISLTCQCASGASIAFEWLSTDSSTGSGTLTGTVNGVSFNAAAPDPTLTQKGSTTESLPGGIVGFVTSGSDANPGSSGTGIHLGWSGSVVLTGQIDDPSDPNTATSNVGQINLYEFSASLSMTAGNAYSYSADVFDDNSSVGGSNDIVVADIKFAGWIGNDGAGHRHTSNTVSFVSGPDTLNLNAGGNLGGEAGGDDLGITFGARGPAENGPLPGPVFIDQIQFDTVLTAPDANFTFVGSIPEPSTAALLAFALGAASIHRRRVR